MRFPITPYKLKKAFLYWKHFGTKEFMNHLLDRMEPEEVPYGPWFARTRAGEDTLKKQKNHPPAGGPLISVVVPAYRTPEKFMVRLIESMTAQSYADWELVIADAGASKEDASGKGGKKKRTVREIAESFAAEDARIRYIALEDNYGISENTNRGVEASNGAYVGFLDHDDFLEPNALYEIAAAILETGADMLYTDEDKVRPDGTGFYQPHFKPCFNLDLLRSNNYITHFLVVKKTLAEEAGLFDDEMNGAQDYDFIFRCSEIAEKIVRVPGVLYHWRTHPGSTAGDPGNKSYAAEAGKNALEEYLSSHGIDAEVRHSRHRGFYDVIYRPDIFTARPDVGVTGGKITDWRRRVVGGQLREDGSVEFLGRDERESGPMHRMDTRHDCAAVDVRCMRIRPELRGLYQEIFGSSYDAHVLLPEVDYTAQSLAFCRRAAALGYRIVWDPEMVLRLS